MAKRKKDLKFRSGGLRKTLFCPLCNTSMIKAKTLPHQHRKEDDGRVILVTRVFYWCPKDGCHSIANFDFREDGCRGDLSMLLELQKKTGKRLTAGKPLVGRFDKIDS